MFTAIPEDRPPLEHSLRGGGYSGQDRGRGFTFNAERAAPQSNTSPMCSRNERLDHDGEPPYGPSSVWIEKDVAERPHSLPCLSY